MKISMHRIDGKFMAGMDQRVQLSLESLPRLTVSARQRPQSLGILANAARTAAALVYLIEPNSPYVASSLDLSRQALNALFACATMGSGMPDMPLGGEQVRYTEPTDASTVYVGSWLDGLFLNLVFGDLQAVQDLCKIPTALLRNSPTKSSEYRYLYKDAICAYVNHESDMIDKTIAALKATDPDRPDASDRAMTLCLSVPQLELLYYAATHDPRFGTSMQRALEKHKDYWSKPTDNARNPRGYFSVDLLGLAVLGLDVGLEIDAESPYLPLSLIREM